jgi:hypothetical protein
MKSEQNHGLTSFDLLTLIFSIGVIFAVSAPILTKNMQTGKIDQAQQELSVVAKSLIKYKPMKSIGFSNRGLASVEEGSEKGSMSIVRRSLWNGDAGVDPWGLPYHYAFVRDSKGTPTKLIVWSAGPDKKNDSYTDVANGATLDGPNLFQGDDLGSVFPLE